MLISPDKLLMITYDSGIILVEQYYCIYIRGIEVMRTYSWALIGFTPVLGVIEIPFSGCLITLFCAKFLRSNYVSRMEARAQHSFALI